MTDQAVINGLYRELLFVEMILLAILPIHNLIFIQAKAKRPPLADAAVCGDYVRL